MKLAGLFITIIITSGPVTVLQTVMAQSTSKTDLEWYHFDEARTLAVDNNKYLFLFFEADWCGFCKQMRNEVFPVPEIHTRMNDLFYPVAVDIESDSVLTYKGKQRSERSFSHLMRINATPTIIFMNGDGDIKGIQRGFLNESELNALLMYVGEGHIDTLKFEDFKKKHLSGE
ncbi:MAG: thioredoxin family protein [Rhodothermaceae bacterium]|nr:thioredoxin family protein [Rhodothermaceae bacterium]